MRAVTIESYGGPEVVRFKDVAVPPLKSGTIRVRVYATPVTAGDVRLRSAKVPRGYGLLMRAVGGFTKPRNPIPGWGLAGVVDAVAPRVDNFSPGDRVFGVTGFAGGAHAEYLVISAGGKVLPLPSTLSFEEGAAFFFGGLTAADFIIDKAQMKPGEHLAILGATGSVGSAAVSIAKHLGLKVTAVASASNHSLAQKLGADVVLDYRTQQLAELYDSIIDVMGTLPRKQALSLLRPGGRLMPVTSTLVEALGAGIRPHRNGKRITGSTTAETLEKMQRLVELHQAGGYRPVVGACLPFEQAAQAHRIAESWHKQGNLVLQLRALEPSA
jgi:NADPH:quinone reductase-like Zn-dependent oxidoreductase